jgi:endoglucanase Acf2
MNRVYEWAGEQYNIEQTASEDMRNSESVRRWHMARAQAYLMMRQYMLLGTMKGKDGGYFYRVPDYG